MRGKLKPLLILILAMVMYTSAYASLDSRVTKKLTGGVVYCKNRSIWQLYQYKDTKLLQKDPFSWCPWLSYLTINKHVTIEDRNNQNCICINANIKNLVSADARYNKKFSRKFKASGSTRQKIRKIYNWCRDTEYTAHVKTAREVFTTHKGDCAGIAAAFYVLCKGKGIPVRYVIGWTEDSCHAWNRVKIDKKWYWIDCTYSLWLSAKQFTGRKVMEVW